MKKKILIAVLFFTAQCVTAQMYNFVFPIVNTVPQNQPEFVGGNVVSSTEYMGKTIYQVDFISQYAGSSQITSQRSPDGYNFISFSYVTKSDGVANGRWNSGSEVKQILFHPGGIGIHDANYAVVNTTYGFVFSQTEGLALCDVNGMNIVCNLDNSTDIRDYASLTVFANSDYTMKDIIVVAGRGRFKVFETIPESSGVRSISSSDTAPSCFGINGQKYDEPQKGINIVVDGDKAKKVVVK